MHDSLRSRPTPHTPQPTPQTPHPCRLRRAFELCWREALPNPPAREYLMIELACTSITILRARVASSIRVARARTARYRCTCGHACSERVVLLARKLPSCQLLSCVASRIHFSNVLDATHIIPVLLLQNSYEFSLPVTPLRLHDSCKVHLACCAASRICFLHMFEFYTLRTML